jgi:hypothetical protein
MRLESLKEQSNSLFKFFKDFLKLKEIYHNAITGQVHPALININMKIIKKIKLVRSFHLEKKRSFFLIKNN